tara:strand:- start:294 stop:419 length:126 start_codon:yes stop_codon:yes gene_type:complete
MLSKLPVEKLDAARTQRLHRVVAELESLASDAASNGTVTPR